MDRLDRLRSLFDRCDLNGDGLVDPIELNAVLREEEPSLRRYLGVTEQELEDATYLPAGSPPPTPYCRALQGAVNPNPNALQVTLAILLQSNCSNGLMITWMVE